MMKTDLLPCPFCGGEAEMWSYHYDTGSVWQVRCKTRAYDVSDEKRCYMADSFIAFPTEQQAIEAWNRRENDAG